MRILQELFTKSSLSGVWGCAPKLQQCPEAAGDARRQSDKINDKINKKKFQKPLAKVERVLYTKGNGWKVPKGLTGRQTRGKRNKKPPERV